MKGYGSDSVHLRTWKCSFAHKLLHFLLQVEKCPDSEKNQGPPRGDMIALTTAPLCKNTTTGCFEY